MTNKNLSNSVNLETALAALKRDYTKLAPRLRALDHTVTCEYDDIILRLHFPSFRQGNATIFELTEAIFHYLVPFCLPRSQVDKLHDLYGKVPANDYELEWSKLAEAARSLFKKANKATNRNGEAGELILYLLTEWILGAPQLLAKMSLKTNPEMPVHGADGVHVRYCTETSRILLYWGESKLYQDVGAAITKAVESISTALKPEKTQHEIELVQRNINLSGLDPAGQAALLNYLDPFSENYNARHDVMTCLIGFDFDAFAKITAGDGDKAEVKFIELAKAKLAELAPTVNAAVKAAGLENKPIEFFFLPVPSVQELRDLFQAKIGWNT